jgi:hypothetical protein
MEFVIFVDIDILLDDAFDVAKQTNVTRFAERNRSTFGATTAGTADTVDIAFRVVRQVIVDDVRDARNVDTTCSNIGRNQNRELAIAEVAQDFLTDALLFVAMDRVTVNAFIAKLERQFVGISLGFGEDQNTFDFVTVQELNQKRHLVMAFHEHAKLGHTIGYAGLRCSFNLDRVFEQTVGQVFDFGRHGCREHHGLVVVRQKFSNGQNVFGEAHVKHTVGFIKDEDFDIVKTNGVTRHVVKQTTRGRNQNINATAQFLNLRAHRRTAIDNRRKQADAFFEVTQALTDLGCQFAGRRKDNRTRLARFRTLRVFGKTLQQGQAESGSFATTRMGNTHKVTPFEKCRNRRSLDFGRRGETSSFNIAQQGLDQVEPIKIRHKG